MSEFREKASDYERWCAIFCACSSRSCRSFFSIDKARPHFFTSSASSSASTSATVMGRLLGSMIFLEVLSVISKLKRFERYLVTWMLLVVILGVCVIISERRKMGSIFIRGDEAGDVERF